MQPGKVHIATESRLGVDVISTVLLYFHRQLNTTIKDWGIQRQLQSWPIQKLQIDLLLPP